MPPPTSDRPEHRAAPEPRGALDEPTLIEQLATMVTEQINGDLGDLDLLPTPQVVTTMVDDHRGVTAAVASQTAPIATAIDLIVDRLGRGGRLVYIGAGTSGRLGVLDASEVPPTFSTDPGLVIARIAGGDRAIRDAVESAEDDADGGAEDLRELAVSADDVVVGISSSGRTPYVLGGLRHAGTVGAARVAISCNENSAVSAEADVAIETVVGPEVLAGSTRLKAGSAQKLVLNILSTVSMMKLGKTYGTHMVDLSATNDKLRARAERTVAHVAGVDLESARAALNASGGSAKPAILALLVGCTPPAAIELLERTGGRLRTAIAETHQDEAHVC